MNKGPAEARALAEGVCTALKGYDEADVALCPTFVCLQGVAEVVKDSAVLLGAQNVHWEASGAFTGEISVSMLKECGCDLAIVGHSERRLYFGETDQTVNSRLKALLAGGLQAIACVGETLEEREAGQAEVVVQKEIHGVLDGLKAEELATITLAYEPLWAIGTGKTASPGQAQEIHALIRSLVAKKFGQSAAEAIRIQYGGSVKPGNAKELLIQPDIDGFLVGGASLVAEDFAQIVKAAG